MINSRSILTVMLSLASATLLSACGPKSTTATTARQYLIYTDAQGTMLEGHDAVALYQQRKLVPGNPQFAATWHDGIYHFATDANRQTFQANPQKYAPLYGGYCAAGVSVGNVVRTDVRTFSYVDDQLVLQKDAGAKAYWDKDIAANFARAQANWPGLAAKRNLKP